MMRSLCGFVGLVLLFPTTALAQPVFFDDFDGNALLPHWGLPRPGDWVYNVSNSMLNVTALNYPSDPKSPGNQAAMGAIYQPLADFRMDVWMGWDAGSGPHRLDIEVLGPGGVGQFATFGFINDPAYGSVPVILATAGNNPAVLMPAPPPGIHQFTIIRVGRRFEYFLNGDFFARQSVNFSINTGGIGFDFVGPYPGPMGALHIDRVQVVPSPATLLVSASLSLLCASRRRR